MPTYRPSASPARQNANYGKGVASVGADVLTGPELAQEIRDVFASPRYRAPLLPQVALEVHQLSRDPRAGIPEVVRLLERDPMLAADVLRIASSAAYASGSPPRSLDEAAARMGLNAIRDVVFQAALSSKVFRAKEHQSTMVALQRHSVAVATATRVVAARTAVPLEHAFLFGLLHDVGLAGILIVLAERHPESRLEHILTELSALHQEAGGVMMAAWALPDELRWLVQAHHQASIGGYVHPLLACEVVGHHLVAELGFGLSPTSDTSLDETNLSELRAAADAIGVDGDRMVLLAREVGARLQGAA